MFERSHTTHILDSILLVTETLQTFLNLKAVRWISSIKPFFSNLLCILPHVAIFCRSAIFDKYTVLTAPKHLPPTIEGIEQNGNYHMAWNGKY